MNSWNKPVVGIVLGAILGFFDGSTAMLYPDSQPLIVSILIGSTFKGLITGLIAGFFARKFQSIPLGVLVGLVAGMAVTYPIAAQPVNGKSYFLEIMIPGTILGAVVGFATQRFGKSAARPA
jgi:LytS/YehU family sensor histidine kinase